MPETVWIAEGGEYQGRPVGVYSTLTSALQAHPDCHQKRIHDGDGRSWIEYSNDEAFEDKLVIREHVVQRHPAMRGVRDLIERNGVEAWREFAERYLKFRA